MSDLGPESLAHLFGPVVQSITVRTGHRRSLRELWGRMGMPVQDSTPETLLPSTGFHFLKVLSPPNHTTGWDQAPNTQAFGEYKYPNVNTDGGKQAPTSVLAGTPANMSSWVTVGILLVCVCTRNMRAHVQVYASICGCECMCVSKHDCSPPSFLRQGHSLTR